MLPMLTEMALDGPSSKPNTGVYVSPSDTGTDPADPDTDSDGVDDGVEVSFGTDPNEGEGVATRPQSGVVGQRMARLRDGPVRGTVLAVSTATPSWSVPIPGGSPVASAPRGPRTCSRASGGVWSEQQKLTASSTSAQDFFGFSVAVSGDTVVVGASTSRPIRNGSSPGCGIRVHAQWLGCGASSRKLLGSDSLAERRRIRAPVWPSTATRLVVGASL